MKEVYLLFKLINSKTILQISLLQNVMIYSARTNATHNYVGNFSKVSLCFGFFDAHAFGSGVGEKLQKGFCIGAV